jgi:hypothetical protein
LTAIANTAHRRNGFLALNFNPADLIVIQKVNNCRLTWIFNPAVLIGIVNDQPENRSVQIFTLAIFVRRRR